MAFVVASRHELYSSDENPLPKAIRRETGKRYSHRQVGGFKCLPVLSQTGKPVSKEVTVRST